jgi:DNA-binding transcriptional MerR regulator
MPEEAAWTLDELVGRVGAVLATVTYPGSPNGRVRDLPDRRAVRWYTTTGLVDRPVMQGRNAIYQTRHLLQIVAVKQLQAQGLSLAEIQAKLAGATDETLRRITDVPGETTAEPAHSTPPATLDRADTVTALAAVSLPGGAMLLVPARPDDNDIPAIRSAAAPLLKLLADRGLLSLDDRSAL